MSDAKKCDRCRQFFDKPTENSLASSFNLHRAEGTISVLVDLCPDCQAFLDSWATGEKLKLKKKQVWTQAQRDAAAERMIERQKKIREGGLPLLWSREDDAKFRKLINSGMKMQEVSSEMNKTIGQCYARSKVLNINKRKRLAQPVE